MSTQNKRKDNAANSCFSSDCNNSICLQGYFRFVLVVIMLNLSLPHIVRGNADILRKAKIPTFPGDEGAGAFTPGGRGGRNCSFHHNLFACNSGRNPSIGWGDHFDFRNNVLFNWRHRTVDGGDAISMVNIVANYYKTGPAVNKGASSYRICRPQHLDMYSEAQHEGKWYVADNFVAGNPKVTVDNRAGGVQFDDAKAQDQIEALIARVRGKTAAPAPPITQQSAEEAYELVLAGAGATLPKRDPVDMRIIRIVRTGKPTYKNGIIDISSDVGGWPQYKSAAAPVDSDHDGMPDKWEKQFGFKWNDPSDCSKDSDNDGYTNVEEWLNGTNSLLTTASPRTTRIYYTKEC